MNTERDTVVRVKLTGKLAEIILERSKELGMPASSFVKANLSHLISQEVDDEVS